MRVDTKALIKKLDPLSLKALEAAINLAVSQKRNEVAIEHWCYKLVEGQNLPFRQLLVKAEINPDDFLKSIRSEACQERGVHQGVPSLSTALTTLIHDAWMLASVDFQAQEINSGHILIALASNLNGFYLNSLAKALLKGINVEEAKRHLKSLQETKADKAPAEEETGSLGRFTTDLLHLAKQGRLDRAIGRNRELNQMIDILCRRKQNNPILVGESGVGKTAIVEELAFHMLEGKVPKMLQNAALRVLDFASLQAGANVQGEFEARIKELLEALEKSPKKIVLFIDEIHNFLGATGKAADAANLLKPALSRGLNVIGATTWAEYKRSFEKDAALSRRFQLVKILEPSEASALDIVRKVSQVLEKHHKVNIEDSALESSVSLSVRYMNHARLPDKAIALLDSACTRIKLQQSMPPLSIMDLKEKIELNKLLLLRLEKELDVDAQKKTALLESIAALESQYKAELKLWQSQVALVKELSDARKNGALDLYFKKQKDLLELQKGSVKVYESVDKGVVSDILSEWTNIPISTASTLEEFQELLSLDEKVKRRVIGQDHAIEMIVDTIRTSKAKLSNPKKPMGVFLLAGESGVGKTETALSLAEVIYGHESRMITINMSEYKEGHKVASLIGAPPGYVGYGEGGRLTEQVRRNPYSVILLDEIEKAHPNVQDLFLQVFDKGTLTDSEGLEVDFKNTIIILTSNLGSKVIKDFCSKAEAANKESNEEALESQDANGQRGAQIPKEELAGEPLEEGKADLEGGLSIEALSQALQTELLKSLKPEFLGRLVVIPYVSLTREILEGIIKIQLGKLAKLLQEHHKAQLTCTDDAVTKILEVSKVSPIGARQIEKIISSEILPDLSIAILEVLSKGKAFGKVELCTQGGELAIGISEVH